VNSPKTPDEVEITLVEIEKGGRMGECNRTACTNVPAFWYNNSTQRWYCQTCAQRINSVCREDICVRKET
jgi:hypothetical protein